MIAIAMLLGWLGYTGTFWGVSLIAGYNLSLKEIASPVGYYKGTWPPAKAGNTMVFPNGEASGEVSASTAATSSTSSNTSSGSGTSAGATSVSNASSIQKAAALFGWGSGTQWNCLTNVITAESGGNPLATNPSSGAFGIAQALGHGTSGSQGSDSDNYGASYGLTTAQAQQANSGNAYYQALWMMGYIKAAYGTPCAAWSHEQSNHWY